MFGTPQKSHITLQNIYIWVNLLAGLHSLGDAEPKKFLPAIATTPDWVIIPSCNQRRNFQDGDGEDGEDGGSKIYNYLIWELQFRTQVDISSACRRVESIMDRGKAKYYYKAIE